MTRQYFGEISCATCNKKEVARLKFTFMMKNFDDIVGENLPEGWRSVREEEFCSPECLEDGRQRWIQFEIARAIERVNHAFGYKEGGAQ